MATLRVKWRRAAFREARTLPKVTDALDRAAETMAAAAGEGYEAMPSQVTGGRGRARAAVVTTTYDAMRDNAENNTLLRSIDAGRLP